MLSMLILWDAGGNVVGTLQHMIVRDDANNVIGLVDFEAHENSGGQMRAVKDQADATGSGTWPEWLGPRAHDFKVELHPSPAPARAKIAALVHKKSGHRRERHLIEAEIERRTVETHAAHRKIHGSDSDVSLAAVDLRDLLGGPDRPLLLDEDGKTKPRAKVKPPNLPVIGRK